LNHLGRHRRLSHKSILVGAALFAVACLSPAPTEPSRPPTVRTGVAPCAPTAAGSPRLIVRRGYLEDPQFRLVESRFTLDGMSVFSSTDEARLQAEIDVVLDAPSAPGKHELTGLHLLVGHGVGANSYLNGYRFRIPSKHSVEVRHVGATCVTVTLWFRESDRIPFEERPALRYDQAWGDSEDTGSRQGQDAG
jgi:hypothetical protein